MKTSAHSSLSSERSLDGIDLPGIKLIRAINGLGSMTWFNVQLIRMSQGLLPDPKMGFIPSIYSYADVG